MKICLKISVKNLDEDDFVDRLSLLLDTHKINPAFLELEFSEKYHFSNISVARDRLRALRDLGVSISIDDFGTGINSLSSLQNIPANVIKIDRRLIKSVIDNPRQQALVKSLIRMAHDLDMQVVAEGLETPAVLEMLVAWRCDYAEGYLFNRPMPAEAFMVWYSHRFSKP